MDVPAYRLPDFDPRSVPVTGTDASLPPVPAERLTPVALRRRFAMPPRWEPEVRQEPRFSDRAMTSAAVLVPLVERADGLSVMLTQRTRDLPTHGGQVAFPGGKADPGDVDARHTALREAQEEIGLERRFVEVVGELPVYVTGSQFRITPVVALVHRGFRLQRNAAEVDDVFEVPLAFLMNPAHHRHHRFAWHGQVREWLSIPYPDAGVPGGPAGTPAQRFVWGATAAMLRNFYRFLQA